MALISLVKPKYITLTFANGESLQLDVPKDFEYMIFNVQEEVVLELQTKGLLGDGEHKT